MRRSTTYATVGALVVGALPALAAGLPTGGAPVLPVGSSASTTVPAPDRAGDLDVLGRLARAGSPVDAAGLATAIAGTLGRGTVLATRPEVRPGSTGGPVAVPVTGTTSAAPLTTLAGDLDGDGTGDLLAVLLLPGEDDAFEVRAVSGRDGRALWSAPVEGDASLATPLGEDVTGDGRDDLLAVGVTELAFSRSAEGDCASGNCRETTRTTEGVRVAVLSGADGATVWAEDSRGEYRSERVETSRSDLRSRDETASWSYAYTSARWPVAVGAGRVYVSGGDGTRTFTASSRSEGVGPVVLSGHDETRMTSRSTTVLDVLLAANGLSLRTRSDDVAGSSYVTGVADVSGDGVPDVLTVEYSGGDSAYRCEEDLLTESCSGSEGARSAAVVVRDGRTLEERWRTTAGDVGGAYPASADLDADGVLDVLVDVFDEDVLTEARSGADGALLWTRPGLMNPLLTASLDGTAGDDLVVTTIDFSDESAPEIARLAGRTGAVLTATPLVWPAAPPARSGSGDSFVVGDLLVTPMADRDRDGVDDLVVRTSSSRYYDSGRPDTTARTALESGRGGAGVVLHEGADDVSYEPAGDLDADGRGDLLRRADRAQLLDADLAVLWSTGTGHVGPAGDLDGVPGDDVVVSRLDELSAHQGSTGARRWRHTG